MARINAPLALVLAAAVPASSFSPSSVAPRHAFSVGRPPSASTSLRSRAPHSEEDAVTLMTRAKECANSDVCSIDEAEDYLRDVIRVQASCVAGTLSGREVCDDVGFAAEVVAGLRDKIENAKSNVGTADVFFSNGALAISDSPSPLQVGLMTAIILTAAAIVNDMNAASTLSTQLPPDVVPFTSQEVWWSVRDGYLGDLVSAYLRDGGLSVGADAARDMAMPIASSVSDVVPFTPQEWWWSARDGYLGDMASAYMRDGGLTGADDAAAVAAVPATAQEWMWAARDGYLGAMASHVFRNGGI